MPAKLTISVPRLVLTVSLSVVLSLGCSAIAPRAAAAGPKGWYGALCGQPMPDRLCCDRPTCCENYCRKPTPYVEPNCCCVPANYCRPPTSCVWVHNWFHCDDYQRKPIPRITCPQWTELHKCPPR